MHCAHCGIYIGRVPWRQHVCEVCLRLIEGGRICQTCKQITYRPVGLVCPTCHANALVEIPAASRPLTLGQDEYDNDLMDDIYNELSVLMSEFAASERDGWFYSDDELGPLGELGMHEVFIED